MKKVYTINFKHKQWKHYPAEELMQRFRTREQAQRRRLELQDAGYIQVSIKKRNK